MILRRFSISATIFISLLLSMMVLFPGRAHAAACDNASSDFFGLPKWYKYLSVESRDTGCNVELPKYSDGKVDAGAAILRIALAIFEIILRFAGIIALIFVVYGGIQYVISQGEPDRLKAARTTLINALVGLVIALSATVIVRLVGGVFN